MVVQRVACLVVVLLGCEGGSAKDVYVPADPSLDDAAFAQPWILIDRISTGQPIDAVAKGAAGYVVITSAASGGRGKVYNRKEFVARSVDGVSWSVGKFSVSEFDDYKAIAYGSGRYVAVGGGNAPDGGAGLVIASRDGVRWTKAFETSRGLLRVAYTIGGFIAVGYGGVIATSIDGSAWHESRVVTGFEMLRDATFGAGRFVSGGQLLVTSRDGREWERIGCGVALPCGRVTDPSGAMQEFVWINHVVFGNDVFLASGAGVLRSRDGLAWERLSDVDLPASAVFTGGTFLSVDLSKQMDGAVDVATSPDGATWTVRTQTVRAASDLTCATNRCVLLRNAILVVPGAPPIP